MNKKCQVFTPQNYVEKLLDSIDYSHNIIGKSIMENSCGDGNILTVVVQRYIDDCRLKGCSVDEIKEGLNRDVHGVEIDPFQFKRCLAKLDDVAGQKGITGVEWDITNEDYLRKNDNKKCAYCGAKCELLPLEYFEVDHFIMESSFSDTTEGRAEAGDIKNLVWACIACNRGKRDLYIDGIYQKILNVDDNSIASVF